MPTRFDFVSPGVLLNEVDESQLPAVVSDDLGPIIIGRSLSGPAMKPIKVKTLDDFNEIFGKGISGKGARDNDIWRNGNLLGPTYGVYAAQAHLASQTTPVTFVRLLGEANSAADANSELAGWSVDNAANPNKLPLSNASAYGLFVFPATGSSATNSTGSLAAIFYVTGAALALSGTTVAAPGATAGTASAGTLINSLEGGVARFKMSLFTSNNIASSDTLDTPTEEFTFNFTPGSSEYIRDVFSTNPQLLQANKNFGLTNKNYFLGESYEEAVRSVAGTATTAGSQYAMLVALDSGSLNYADHFKDMKPAKTGWFLNRKPAQEKLFRCAALHDGEWLQNNYDVVIKDLSLGNVVEPNSTFTLEIVESNGTVVEQYSNLNLDPSSENYIAKVIGDQYLEWDATNLKYNVRGEYANTSDYIYIEVTDAVKNQQLQDRHALPVGFVGPLKPKNVKVIDGRSGVLAEHEQVAGQAATLELRINGTMANGEVLGITGSNGSLLLAVSGADGTTTATSFTTGVANMKTGAGGFAGANTSGSFADALATLLNSVSGYNAEVNLTKNAPEVTVIMRSDIARATTDNFGAISAGDITFGLAASGSTRTSGADESLFAHPFVVANASVPCFGGDANNFASCPPLFTGSLNFPSLRLTDENSNSTGKNYPPTQIFGVRHHRGQSIRRDDSYNDLVRVLPSNASVTLTHHLAEGASLPDALEYQFIFTMDDIMSGSNTTNEFFVSSGSYDNAASAQRSISAELGLNTLFQKKVRQYRAPFFGGHNGLDLTEVEPFSNKNLTDKNRLGSYEYNSIFKALETIEDAESTKYSVLAIPGITNTDVTDEIISLASKRQDFLGIIDLPNGHQPGYENNGVVNAGSLNTTITNLEGRLINNSYVAAYYPWVRLRDRVGGQNDVLYAPPSVAAIGALAKSQGLSELWFAPAGFNRGGINELGGPAGPIVNGTWEHLTKTDRDRLYEANINPIARFPSLNQIVVFGQKTLQQNASALDRINVRRLLIYLKYRIGLIADTILFDQNVRTTWNRFRFQANAILADTQARLGISEYRLVLDDSTTTADYVDRNIIYAKIFIKPVRAVEFIAVDFIISRSGVQF